MSEKQREQGEQRKTREILPAKRLEIIPLTKEDLAFFREQMLKIHTAAWNMHGLCTDPNDPASMVDKFNPEETISVREGEKLYAMINTLGIKAGSISEVCDKFSNYQTVVNSSIQNAEEGNPVKNPNYRLCFSITTARTDQQAGYSVKTEAGKELPLATFLLSQIPKDGEERIVAYSRFGNVDDDAVEAEQILAFYQQNIQKAYGNEKSKESARALGATWTHTRAGNALEVAILLNARPEDKKGGGANVLCAYPRDEEEAELFAEIRQKRMNGEMPYTLENGNIIFTDIQV